MEHTKEKPEYVLFETGESWDINKEDEDGFEYIAEVPKSFKSNAELICEAFNVSNETGKTPRQLADENKELLEALQEIKKGEGAYNMDKYEHANNTIENMKSLATQAINKATN